MVGTDYLIYKYIDFIVGVIEHIFQTLRNMSLHREHQYRMYIGQGVSAIVEQGSKMSGSFDWLFF